MSAAPARAVAISALVAIVLAGIAGWLLNVPLVALIGGMTVALVALLLWLSRHDTGKRSGVSAPNDNSRAQ